jgi:hypothetical protein
LDEGTKISLAPRGPIKYRSSRDIGMAPLGAKIDRTAAGGTKTSCPVPSRAADATMAGRAGKSRRATACSRMTACKAI